MAVTCFLTAACAAEDARYLLEKMRQAMQQQHYQGEYLSLQAGGHIETMRINHHHHPQRGEVERLLRLNGPLYEILRDRQHLVRFSADGHKTSISRLEQGKMLSDIVPTDLPWLQKSYRLHWLGDDRIANRAAHHVAIQARDRLRYSHHFWIDQEQHLLLRHDILDQQQRAVQQLIFIAIKTEVNNAPELASLLNQRLERLTHGWRTLPKSGAKSASLPWSLGALPPGFRLLSQQSEQHNDRLEARGKQLLLSDGLALVSLFIESKQQPVKNPPAGFSRFGSVNLYTALRSRRIVTAVGMVPPSLLRYMVNILKTPTR